MAAEWNFLVMAALKTGDMKKLLAIDLRWIHCSGIGTYIRGLMPGLVTAFSDVRIAGIGNKEKLQKYPWASASHFKIVDCDASRYSIAEQVVMPLAIPRGTDLFYSPHYPVPLLFRGRLVVTIHDLSHLVVPEIATSMSKRTYAKTMLNAVRRRASLILTVSNFSKSELLKHTRGLRSDNIVTIHEGISGEWFAARRVPLPEQPYIVYVGNVKPYKNVSRLVEAFLRVMDKIPHNLLIVGQHEGLLTGESNGFFARASSAGERIRFTGHIPQEQLLTLVAGADALVLPSLYEGFGFPPLEAMAAGVPALVARAGSLPEICGDAALFCDPLSVEDIAEKITSIVTDQELRNGLVQSGKQQASRYSWDICAQQTASAIRSVL
jgi:glycosyltransferase involved in cell wall biosynthesis